VSPISGLSWRMSRPGCASPISLAVFMAVGLAARSSKSTISPDSFRIGVAQTARSAMASRNSWARVPALVSAERPGKPKVGAHAPWAGRLGTRSPDMNRPTSPKRHPKAPPTVRSHLPVVTCWVTR